MNEHTDLLERQLLGSLLRHNPAIADVVAVLTQEDFRTDAHRKVFAAIVELWSHGKPADLTTVADALHQRGQIEDLGGYDFLADLWTAEPTGANAVYYAELVRHHSLLRQLRGAAVETLQDADHPTGPAEEMLQRAEQRIFRIAQNRLAGAARPLAEVVNEVYDRIDARSGAGPALGVPTGLPSLDRLLGGGLQPSELVVIAARPAVGKTAFGLHLARHAAVAARLPVLFVSLEQAGAELGERLLCAEGGVDTQRVRRGVLSDQESRALTRAGDSLRPAPLEIDDTPSQRLLRIAATARRLKLQRGIVLVVVDYLQLIEPEARGQPRHEQVAQVSRGLKQLAREVAVPVVALAQLNRASEDRPGGRPRLSDLRESGSIEADADTVLLLHPEEKPGRPDLLDVLIAKQRNGPTGEVVLAFDKPHMRFVDPAADPSEAGDAPPP